MLAKDEQKNNSLSSFGSLYIRKRYWFHNRIPYVLAAPYFGLGLYPSVYANVGGELLLGRSAASIFERIWVMPTDSTGRRKILSTFRTSASAFSALDFTNRVEETQREWKEYVHSAIRGVDAECESSEVVRRSTELVRCRIRLKSKLPITGMSIQLGTAHFPLPFADRHFWAGTSLVNFFSLGYGTGPRPAFSRCAQAIALTSSLKICRSSHSSS